MFGLFRKKPSPSPVVDGPDHVYLAADVVARVVSRAVRVAQSQGRRAAVLVPFVGHVAAVRARLAREGLEVAQVTHSVRDAAAAHDAVYALAYEDVSRYLATAADAGPQRFFRVDRHPLRAADAAIEHALEQHNPQHRVHTYLSLDEGILRLFDPNGSTAVIMRKLEMSPEDPIEHPLVTRSIENAQEKFAKRAHQGVVAATLDEWIAQSAKRG